METFTWAHAEIRSGAGDGNQPTREALPDLENKRFGAVADPKCDGRVNFRDIWGHVGIHQWAKCGIEPTSRRFLTGHERS
jgi:hypothetical protein